MALETESQALRAHGADGDGADSDRGGEDRAVRDALARGDDEAFARLVEQHHARMLCFARACGCEPPDAPVHRAWEEFLAEGACAGRIAIRICLYRALVAQVRAALAIPSATRADRDDEARPLDGRFLPPGHRWAGHWTQPPPPLAALFREARAAPAVRAAIRAAITELPIDERELIVLRDVEGWTPDAVCDLFGLDLAAQRARLHAARTRVLASVERALAGGLAGGLAGEVVRS